MIDNLKEQGRLLYQYVAGSTLYNCNTKDSDIDTKGIFISDIDGLFGLGFDEKNRLRLDLPNMFQPQIADSRSDNVLYELGKFMSMILTSNPTVLESLFVPEDKILVKPHIFLNPLFENRNMFITKACFNSFARYAIEQIKKARGLNKKIVNPMTERLGVLDFTYTFYKQGSTKITNWLEYRGLNQKYCGLVNIPNMRDIYGVYYDWGRFFEEEGITEYKFDEIFVKTYQNKNNRKTLLSLVDKLKATTNKDKRKVLEDKIKEVESYNMIEFICNKYGLIDDCMTVTSVLVHEWYKSQKPLGYKGIVGENSDSVRLQSVSKGETPICYVSYNKDGYKSHCRDYKEYKLWEKERNEKRYESNLNKTYDSKNMYHCVRLMHMGKEIANGDGIILNRELAGDRDFLMGIREHKFEYDELMEIITHEEEELKIAIENSTIPNDIDASAVNDMLIDIRRKFYGISTN